MYKDTLHENTLQTDSAKPSVAYLLPTFLGLVFWFDLVY